MAVKRKTNEGPSLYERHERILERRLRRQRALFIPRLLDEAAANQQLTGEAQDQAYAIACRWADLESGGHLAKHKETSIDTQFLDQLFGEGLGFKLKTASPSAWQLEHKFTVSGVGIADGAIGDFPKTSTPSVIIELKDSQTDLDRDRSNGRTPVQQCWDYLNALPDTPWGIVSNFSIIRLYHREKGTLSYEEFTLQELRDRKRFKEFYCIFERSGLLASKLAQLPRAQSLLQKTIKRQREVGSDLYDFYHIQRLRMIEHLHVELHKPLDPAIRIAQKLLDRVLFIAFCEDRDLLPEKCLDRAYSSLPAFSKVTNPRWHSFLALFNQVDKGSEALNLKKGYNGGLFAYDPEVDALELADDPWTVGFKGFGSFDFSEEVNVEVLGHLFERSVTELEKLRAGGLYALKANAETDNGNVTPAKRTVTQEREEGGESTSRMPKSAQRKRFGIYYTPPAFTGLIVERTVGMVINERFAALRKSHGVDPENHSQSDKRLLAYWQECLETLKDITICDPACGSGAFLIRAYDFLDAHYKVVVHGLAGAGEDDAEVTKLEDAIPDLILNNNLYGVDLSKEAVEITQLALWLRSARPGKTLTDLSRHIYYGNSLISEATVDPRAIDWKATFPTVFDRREAGFTCVIGNPPWERVKVQDREFFSLTDPRTAEAVNANDRKKRIASMSKTNPELYASYERARELAQKMLDYARGSGRYPLTGKGDVNLYMLFVELAESIVAPHGINGLLVPSGIATDDTTKKFFSQLMDNKALVSLYDFENRAKVFEDVDSRFKFSAIIFGGTERKTEQADFVFFAHGTEDVSPANRQRHITLTAADMLLLNPNTRTCPVFRTRRDAEITKAIYRRVPILLDENRRHGGNPWGIRFMRMFDQTNDSEKFHPEIAWETAKCKLVGNRWIKGKRIALPLYEAKMIQAYDHRAASVVIEGGNWVRQGQKAETTPVEHANPEFLIMPRWWVSESDVLKVVGSPLPPAFLCYKDITSPTNERTMIASFVPAVAMVNSAPIVFVEAASDWRRKACLLANMNSFVYDFVARQKVGGVHLNFFIVQQLPALPPETYEDKAKWAPRDTLVHWISERVLKLSCTAEDMKPLAAECDFKGSNDDGVHKWRDTERTELRAELDAAFAHLYGLDEEDFAYILTTFPSVPEHVILECRNAYRALAQEIIYAR